MNNFNEFRETLTDELKADISARVRKKICELPDTDNGIQDLASTIATMSFNYSLELLEQYHEWLSRDS